jgi:hypothetical protein
MLRDFSNTDKHRLIPSAFFAHTRPPSVEAKIVLPAEIEEFNLSKPGQPLENEAEIGRVRVTVFLPVPPGAAVPELPSNAQVDVGAYLHVTVHFGPVRDRWARIRDFRALLDDVRSTTERFASA